IPQNGLDAAIARVLTTDAFNFNTDIVKIGKVTGTRPPTLGMRVRKYGRTTEYTEGTVTLINATIDVAYSTLIGRRTARFTGQVMTTGMSAGGDSGSLIVAGDSQDAVGLLFAGSGAATIFTPIERVLSKLKVKINPNA
ncbi:MAG: serine protease, partial [Chloroflexota bacterium]